MVALLVFFNLVIVIAALMFVAFQFNFWKAWRNKQTEPSSSPAKTKSYLLSSCMALVLWLVYSAAGLFVAGCLKTFCVTSMSGLIAICFWTALFIILLQLVAYNPVWRQYRNNNVTSGFDIFEMSITRGWYTLFLIIFFGLSLIYGYFVNYTPDNINENIPQVVAWFTSI